MRLFPAFLDELGFLGKDTGVKGIFSFYLTPVITLAVIDRSIISNGITRALLVVELHVAIKYAFHLIPGAASVNLEVHEEFFLDPTFI